MIEILFLFLAIAMSQVNKSERMSAAIFTLMTLSFYFVDMILPDRIYYIVAAGVDILIMSMLYLYYTNSGDKMSVVLCFACLLSVVIQFYGWCVYKTGGAPQIYNYLAIMFYVCVIILFISRIRPNERAARNSGNVTRFFRDNSYRA